MNANDLSYITYKNTRYVAQYDEVTGIYEIYAPGHKYCGYAASYRMAKALVMAYHDEK